MRDVLPSVIDHLDYDRQVSGNVRIRDNRLRFAQIALSMDTPIISTIIKSIDSATIQNGILRVANINSQLWFHWMSDPASPSEIWRQGRHTRMPGDERPLMDPIELMPGSKPTVYGNRLFYQIDTGELYYTDIDLANPIPQVSIERPYVGTYATPTALAAVSQTEMYVVSFEAGSPYAASKIEYRMLAGGTVTAWHGRVYSDEQTHYVFTAVRYASKDHLFINDMGGKRGMTVTHVPGGAWSELRTVMPLDVVDEHMYKITGATQLGDYLFVSGIFHRETGVKMHFYARGPAPYTAGRDLYIGSYGTEPFVQDGTTYPALGGKLHQVGDKLYYISFGFGYKCDATWLVGYDPGPSYERDVDDINTIKIDYTINESGRASFDIAASEYGVNPIRAGSEFDLNIAYNDQSAKMGTFWERWEGVRG